jgi:hypothetical protein
MRIIAVTEAEYGVVDLRLEGGTALAAYHLGHRESEDLDCFGNIAMNAAEFARRVGDAAENDGLEAGPAGPASVGFARLVVRDSATPLEPAVKLDFAVQSSFRLAPMEVTAEGMRIASYRDLCAGKLHAACDRFAERDFVDLHAIVHRVRAAEGTPDEGQRRARFRALVRDLMETDPGMGPALVGQGLERALVRPLVSRIPLRLLTSVSDAEIHATLRLCVDECARLVADGIGN